MEIVLGILAGILLISFLSYTQKQIHKNDCENGRHKPYRFSKTYMYSPYKAKEVIPEKQHYRLYRFHMGDYYGILIEETYKICEYCGKQLSPTEYFIVETYDVVNMYSEKLIEFKKTGKVSWN